MGTVPGVLPADTLPTVYTSSQNQWMEITLAGDTTVLGFQINFDSVHLDAIDGMPVEVPFECLRPVPAMSYWDTTLLHHFCFNYAFDLNYTGLVQHNPSYPAPDQVRFIFSKYMTIPFIGNQVMLDTVEVNYTFVNWWDSFPIVIEDQPSFRSATLENPAGDMARIWLEVSEPGQLEISAIDMAGRQVMQRRWDVTRPGRQDHDWSVEDWPAGVYIIHVRGRESSVRLRLLKQ